MIHAAIFRTEYDKPFIDDAVNSAWRWASTITVFSREEQPERDDDVEMLQVNFNRDKDMLEFGWYAMGSKAKQGEWVVLLMGDEVVFDHDALVRASKQTQLDSLLFNIRSMWDDRSYLRSAIDRPMLRALRHQHKPIVFPEYALREGDLAPIRPVTPYMPVGDILQLRWMDEQNREALDLNSITLDTWGKGDIRVVR